MADTLSSILEKLEERIKGLNAQIGQLQADNETLRSENSELVRKAREAEEERDKALLDIEYLTVSHKLAEDPDSLIKSRRHISQLIRNIDRCLEMLKD